jgi:hypothetical protein
MEGQLGGSRSRVIIGYRTENRTGVHATRANLIATVCYDCCDRHLLTHVTENVHTVVHRKRAKTIAQATNRAICGANTEAPLNRRGGEVGGGNRASHIACTARFPFGCKLENCGTLGENAGTSKAATLGPWYVTSFASCWTRCVGGLTWRHWLVFQLSCHDCVKTVMSYTHWHKAHADGYQQHFRGPEVSEPSQNLPRNDNNDQTEARF